MTAVTSPAIFRFFSKHYLLCEIPVKEKTLFLTFDDGPVPEITGQVLGILKERDARATFFVTGDNVRKHPELFDMIVSDGHSIGNHTFSHLNGWKTATGAYVENVTRCSEYFTTNLFRPPYGRFLLSQYFLLRKSYKFIMWSVLTQDYSASVTPDQCLQNAIQYSRPGSIVVFHDNPKAATNVLFALPRFIDHFHDLGYSFGRIEVER